jgi:chromate reductase
MAKKIAVLVGSLRRDSYNLKIAKEFIQMAPASLKLEIVEIGNLPHYNEDHENNVPKEYTAFRQKIKEADGFLFVTPEYNRSVPSALKNAFDVASRPWGQNLYAGKPGGVVSVSIGPIGGFGANHIVRQSMAFLDVYMMQQPEMYIGNASSLFDQSGKLVNEDTRKFLQRFIDSFAAWVARF